MVAHNQQFGNITSVYFLGIGGIGMSAIARFFFSKGFRVAGYDRTPSPLTDELQREGIEVVFDETLAALPDAFREKEHTLVVLTPAIPASHEQWQWFLSQGFLIQKRSEVLGDITRQMKALCVAGTHGKTTTSTILAHLMYQSEIGCNAFLGGLSCNYSTNLLLDANSNYVVVEADEYDRSFHRLTPYMSVITAADPDHLDIYGDAAGFREGFEHYTSLIQAGGVLLLKKGVDITPRLQHGVKVYTYALDDPTADFHAENILVKDGTIYFDFVTPQMRLNDLRLGVPVYINIENSVAAMAIAWLNGVSENELRLGIASYTGIYRRFNIHLNTPQIAYIDDYAHHPTELNSSIQSIRRLYPDRYMIGCFQPHLYTRTRDFADGFAQSLSHLDEAILLPIYPAREEPIEGVNSEMLLQKITCKEKTIKQKQDLLPYLQQRVLQVGKPVVVITLGAGDIDRLVPQISKGLAAK